MTPTAQPPRKRRRYNITPREPRVSVTFDLPMSMARRLATISGQDRGARSRALRQAVELLLAQQEGESQGAHQNAAQVAA